MLTAALLLVFQIVVVQEPGPPPKLTQQDVARGAKLFQAQCAYCHGPGGDGGRGANLARPKLRHAPDDKSLFRVINSGIPDTGMPGNAMSAQEVWQVVGFVRSLGRVTHKPLPGNTSRGERIYAAQGCANCHTIAGHGGPVGPDLSDIGARSSATYLNKALTEPEADVPNGFLQVRAVTRDGGLVTGVRVNEDAFSIQIRELNGRFYSFWKDELKELFKDWGKSPMPSYRNSLSQSQLDDLIAYLVSLEDVP
jgi:putative heme-binding domain-containing protein